MAAIPHAQQHASLLLPHGTQFNSPHEMPTRKATSVNILAILRRMKATSLVQKTDLFASTGGRKNVLWSCEKWSRINYRSLPGAHASGALRFLRARAHLFASLHAQYNQTMYTEDSKLFTVYINFNAPLIVCCHNHLSDLFQTLIYSNTRYRSKYCRSDWR